VPHPLFARENVNRHQAPAHHHHGSMATCTVTDGAMQPTNPSEVVNADGSSTRAAAYTIAKLCATAAKSPECGAKVNARDQGGRTRRNLLGAREMQ